MKTLIKLTNLKKVFSTDEVETHALSDINLEVKQGEYLSIAGPSGCGKSTLLSLLGLLDTSSGGSYNLNGHDVVDINGKQRAAIRNKEIGFVFQSFNLISELTVAENVALPLTYRKDLSKSQRAELVTAALEKVDMNHRTKHYPSQLSGGQQQRVAVARAIAGNPSIILADEPTGNLDSKNAELVMALLDKLHAEGATICMVTHDPRGAKRAERVIEIFDGRIVSDSPTMPSQIEEAVA
ncbi:ABC transporter ATP-binding protein [Colwellia psychrerythraea]|uniref:Phosphonate-transporting ATPase n=1 Tax=Colwellia psychrerythraea TaxID=28229 RepID=A0A099L6Y3_COLPS|nr:ABC transporter ATP-binding protein [Colwellia psychrerythraea]KGJ97618.1 Phosphonate-transporting ATPase [Colwellia psychrerythraea]